MIEEFGEQDKIDFDITSEDIETFDPMMHKMTDDIAEKLDQNNKVIESKQKKKVVIQDLVVKINGITFNGDDTSQNRMAATGTLAHYFFISNLANTIKMVVKDPKTTERIMSGFDSMEDGPAKVQAQQLAVGITLGTYSGLAEIIDGVYDEVYKNTKIGWKDADGKIRQLYGKTVLTALHKSMIKVGEVIAKAEQGLL